MNGGSLILSPEDTLTLTLAGNPTTGYTWQVLEMDQNVLAPVGEVDYRSASNLIGAGGVYTFKFKTQNSGSTILKLIYIRSFEQDVPPADTFEIEVKVE